MKILGISGSLREKSCNTALLCAAKEVAPDGMDVEICTLKDIPLYNEDLEQKGFPESVLVLKEKIKSADGIIIMLPEYNHSIPGVLKNAIDWVSRGENECNDKPVAMGGGSKRLSGTSRMQVQLLAVLNVLNMHVMSTPLFQVPNVDKKIDEAGKLIDDKTKEKLIEFLSSFQKWVEQLQK